jgi:hypothetical protein
VEKFIDYTQVVMAIVLTTELDLSLYDKFRTTKALPQLRL